MNSTRKVPFGRLMMHKWIFPAALVAVSICSLTHCRRPQSGGTRPNVILISVDTLRADRLGCYGYEKASTPHIDSLAAEGTLFQRVISQAPITLPSHATMLTGLTPASHAVHDNGSYRLPEEHKTLAEHLKEEGYRTGAVIGGFPLSSQFGTAQGFDFYSEQGLRSHQVLRSPDPDRQVLLQGTPPDRPADAVTRDALRWISTLPPQEPFFLFVHYYDPHSPYEAPEEYRARHDSAYDAEIAFTDKEIGRLLDGIDARGLLEGTLIVFTSDHGEALGDHGELTHGYLLHDSTLRVPLLLHGPRVPAGKRIQGLAQLADIVPTVLDLLSQPVGGLDGRSLVPLLQGKPASKEIRIYSECLLPHFSRNCYPIRCLTSDEWRYIDAGKDELFHLTRDADEDHNVAREHKDRVGAMKSQLEQIPLVQDPQARHVISEKDAQELRALGYLGAGLPAPVQIRRQGRNPRDITPLISTIERAKGAMRNTRFDEAKDLLKKVLERLPGDPDVLEQMALCCFALDDLEEAARYAKEALQIVPTRPSARKTLARCHTLMGDWETALSVYEEGARLVAGTQPYLFHFNMADCYVRLGDIDKALSLAEQAAHQVDDPALKVEYAAFLMESVFLSDIGRDQARRQKLFRQAVTSLREALVLDPYNVGALYHLGVYFMQTGRLYSGLAFFHKALRIDPQHIESHNNAATCYLRQYRYPEALRHYEYLIHRHPTLLSPRIGRACALFAQGSRDEGLALLKELLTENPHHPKVLYNLSFCYEQLGQTAEALRGYKELLQILPQGASIRLQAQQGIQTLTLPEGPRES